MKRYWPTIRDYLLILIATLIQAIALRLFFVPANLASGGVTGISQLLNHFTGWPIGFMVFIGNIPLFLLGWRFLGGARFATRTAFAIFMYSAFTDLLVQTPLFAPYGMATKLIGGSDILARILSHYRGIPMTQSYLMVDTVVILGAGFVFGWKAALYAMVALYVSGLAAETTLEGGGTVRTALIITSEPEVISERVLEELERGVTVLEGTGAYTGAERPVLYCVITRAEVAALKEIVHEVDPKAFMVIGVAHEALGEGFRPLRLQE